jgi:hypothetical protein
MKGAHTRQDLHLPQTKQSIESQNKKPEGSGPQLDELSPAAAV